MKLNLEESVMPHRGDAQQTTPVATVTTAKLSGFYLGKYFLFNPPIKAVMISSGGLNLPAWDKYEFERGLYLGVSQGLLIFRGRPSNAQMLVPVGADVYGLGWLAEFTFFISPPSEGRAVLDTDQSHR